MDIFDGAVGIDDAEPLRFSGGALQKGVAYFVMEVDFFLFKTVVFALCFLPFGGTGKSGFGGQVHKNGQIRDARFGGYTILRKVSDR